MRNSISWEISRSHTLGSVKHSQHHSQCEFQHESQSESQPVKCIQCDPLEQPQIMASIPLLKNAKAAKHNVWPTASIVRKESGPSEWPQSVQ